MPKSPEVDAWFASYDHPLRDAMRRVRDLLLAADPRIGECIKWKTPTFTYEGNLASFNPRSKAHVSLLFHTGASIPGDHPRLEGGGDTARYLKIASVEEAEAARGDLERIVAAWIASRGAGKATTPRGAKTKAGPKKKAAETRPAPKKRAPAKKPKR